MKRVFGSVRAIRAQTGPRPPEFARTIKAKEATQGRQVMVLQFFETKRQSTPQPAMDLTGSDLRG